MVISVFVLLKVFSLKDSLNIDLAFFDGKTFDLLCIAFHEGLKIIGIYFIILSFLILLFLLFFFLIFRD